MGRRINRSTQAPTALQESAASQSVVLGSPTSRELTAVDIRTGQVLSRDRQPFFGYITASCQKTTAEYREPPESTRSTQVPNCITRNPQRHSQWCWDLPQAVNSGCFDIRYRTGLSHSSGPVLRLASQPSCIDCTAYRSRRINPVHASSTTALQRSAASQSVVLGSPQTVNSGCLTSVTGQVSVVPSQFFGSSQPVVSDCHDIPWSAGSTRSTPGSNCITGIRCVTVSGAGISASREFRSV